MNIGIIPGWLLAAVIAIWIGGFPADLCLAGAAVGISLSVAGVARSRNALVTGIPPLMTIAMRYMVLPTILTGGVPQDEAWLVGSFQWSVSPRVLIGLSLLSIVASYLLGMKWVYRGEA
jgi:hypothetical protein